tara:strand:+ start:3220 stop:3867 length:648 start_codon:yes stop_codon:yes gene_type:complete
MMQLINILRKIKKFIIQDSLTEEYERFISDGGDEIIFKKINLSSNSIVIDGGGFNGEFTDQLIKKNCKNIIIYEPDNDFFLRLSEKYSHTKNIKVINLALYNRNQKINLSNNANASSIMEKSDIGEKVNAIDVGFEFKNYEKIDLLKLNIEGAEYDVLDRLIETQEIRKIKYLLVQFHQEHDLDGTKFNSIFSKIKRDYEIIFNYKYVWSLFIKK